MKASSAGQRPGFLVRAILIAFALGAVSPAHAVAIGELFRLAPEESRETFLPSIASDTDGSFVAAWSTPQGIYARRFSATAEPVSEPVLVSAADPYMVLRRVALAPGKGFAVVWQHWSDGIADIYERAFDVNGAPRGPQVQVGSSDGGGPWDVTAAADPDGNFWLAWGTSSQADQLATLRARKFSSNGEPAGEEMILTQSPALSPPQIAVGADGLPAIAWVANSEDVYFARVTEAGLSGVRKIADSAQQASLWEVRMVRAGSGFQAVWGVMRDFESEDLYGQRLTAAGEPDGAVVTVNATPASPWWGPALSLAAGDDGYWVASWTAELPDSSVQTYARRFHESTPTGPELHVNGSAKAYNAYNASVAMQAGGAFIATWESFPPFVTALGRRYGPGGFVDLASTIDESADPVENGSGLQYTVHVVNQATALVAPDVVADIRVGRWNDRDIEVEGISASGWTCTATGTRSFHCVYGAPLAPGAIAAPITVVVRASVPPEGPFGAYITVDLNSAENDLNYFDNWELQTTTIKDTAPELDSFGTRAGVLPGSLQVSDTVIVSGITEAVPISVANGSYSLNGGEFTEQPGMVFPGAYVQLRHSAATEWGASQTTTVQIGNGAGTFTSTTADRDVVPDSFGFQDQAGVPRQMMVTSAEITIQGINDAAPVVVSNGQYSINEGAFTNTDGMIVNGQRVRVRHVSASGFLASVNTVLTVGSVSDAFTSTTLARDITPDVFSFVDRSGVARSANVVSDEVAISGINDATPISVSGGQYSIDGGVFTAAAGTILNGQKVRVQHTSSSTFSTGVNAVLNIGGVTDTFTSTTAARDVVPDAFAFANRDDVARHAAVISDDITITGINDAAPIGVSGGQYSVDGGNFTATNGTVTNGQKVRVKHTAAADFSTARKTVLTVGGVSGTFTSTTEAEDLVPDAFSFQDQTGAIPTAQVTSNTVTIAGINSFSPLTVSGGMYSVNGSGYTSVATKVRAGDRITLRVTAATLPTGTTSATLTIGGVSDTWTVQTLP